MSLDPAEGRAVHDEQFEAMVLTDLPVLETLLDDAFVIEHPTGLVQSKAEWLADIDDDRKSYHVIDHVECAVTGSAEHPVVTSRTLTEATMGGLHGTWRLQLRSRLVRLDGEWVITRTVASTW